MHGISKACSGTSGLSLQLGMPVVYSGGMTRIVACIRKDLEPGDTGENSGSSGRGPVKMPVKDLCLI